MIKKENGVTLIALTIAVIIILTLTGMIVYSAKDSVYIKNLTNMKNDISNLRDKVSSYYSEYGKIPATTEYTDVSNLQSADILGENDTGKFLVIELKYLDGLTLNYGKDYEKYKAGEYSNITDLTDIYVINENSNNIFYIEGIRVKENGQTKMYYTDYTNGDSEKVNLKQVSDWHEDTNESGEKIITNGVTEMKIGDYINYNPKGEAKYKTYTSNESVNGYQDQTFELDSYTSGWRILGFDEEKNEILLVSADSIGPDIGGEKGSRIDENDSSCFVLKSEEGYANGIKELDNISKMYGQGKGADSARSITINDVNKLTGYDPETSNYEAGQKYAYGNEMTYSGLSKYYDEENDEWKRLDTNEPITIKSNYYAYSINDKILSDSIEADLLNVKRKTYWTKDRFAYTIDNGCYFGIRCVYKNSTYGMEYGGLYSTFGNKGQLSYGVRPVVSLKSSVVVLQKDGTSENPHEIQ